MSSFMDVEQTIGYGVGNKPRLWYPIPGYNGYEISDDGYVRSMKHFKQYPTGLLLRVKGHSTSHDPIFELSDNNNRRIRLKRSTLWDLAIHNPRGVIPRYTLERNIGSRNKILMDPYRNEGEREGERTKRTLFNLLPDEPVTVEEKPNVKVAVHFFVDTDIKY